VSLSQSAVDVSQDELDRRWRAPLMVFFGRRLGSRQEAEDLTQETFVRLIRTASTTEEQTLDAKPGSYVFTVASNLLRDHARKTRTHHSAAHCSIEDASASPELGLIDDIEPERVLLGEERLKLALEALDELGERTADIFILVRMEKMKQREVAALYGISVSAVEKHLAKAMAHLAASFDS